MTILVLEIAVPTITEVSSGAALNDYFISYLVPAILIYFISFYLVYNFWENTVILFNFKKRKEFRKSFDNFDVVKVANYIKEKINELLDNEKIIRYKGKITSAINNANVFIEIQNEFGSFDEYIWGFTNGEIIKAEYLTESELSKKVSKDLKNRGMKFVDPIIIYSYLESIGIINNHQKDCFKF